MLYIRFFKSLKSLSTYADDAIGCVDWNIFVITLLYNGKCLHKRNTTLDKLGIK